MNRKYKLANYCYHSNQTASFRIFKKKRKKNRIFIILVFAKKRKVWDKKHVISKFLKEATNDYLLYVLDKCLFNGYSQASFTIQLQFLKNISISLKCIY
jgi:hypothetical protein